MSKHLQRDLDLLERKVLSQSSLVEEMIRKACKAIHGMRPDLVSDVIKQEDVVNEQEVEIEESCLKILALHQPVAVDLRQTATILKINNDLERIADLAVNIAERAQSLWQYSDFIVPEKFERMSQLAVMMVQEALDALVKLDVDTAREVCLRDNDVDSLNREVIQEMRRLMRSQPDLIEAALYLFSASRHLERIADHATNIAEDVIYLVDGEIARHSNDLQPLAH